MRVREGMRERPPFEGQIAQVRYSANERGVRRKVESERPGEAGRLLERADGESVWLRPGTDSGRDREAG